MSSWSGAQKGEVGGRLSQREKERLAELGEVKVVAERRVWKEVVAEKPASSGEEEVVVRKVKRRYYRVRTRLASCFCSQCQIFSKYEECHINRTYPALVPAMMDDEVKEPVIMNTGVLSVGVDEP